MRTTAIVTNGPGEPFSLEEVELDAIRADEIRVRAVATGLCHTDVTLRNTLPAEMFPRILGHEGAGVVEEVGAEVTGVAVGDHVVASFRSCRACARCTGLGPGYCENTVLLNYLGYRMDGTTTYSRAGAPVQASFFGQSSFAGDLIVHPDNVVVVDQALDLTRLGPYGCGFQTGAGTVLNVLQPGPDDSLAVFGVGAVGLAALAAARQVGTLIAVDVRPERLAVAEKYGATAVDARGLESAGVVDRIKELTGGQGASYGIDTTGIGEVIKQAAQALAVKGELAVLALGAEEFPVDAIDIMMNGKVIRGTVEGDSDPQEMIPRLLALAASGAFDVDDLITTYPVSEVNNAVEDALAGAVVKPVLVW
jgi:aryl-alcohol dehydrogenase